VQSVGEERNAYRHICPCLVQYGTTGKCPLFCYRDFFMAFGLGVVEFRRVCCEFLSKG
jgi:hypothetical protein